MATGSHKRKRHWRSASSHTSSANSFQGAFDAKFPISIHVPQIPDITITPIAHGDHSSASSATTVELDVDSDAEAIMAGHYDLRSQQDQSSSYASLPGLAPRPVSQNMTTLKSRIPQNVQGCHPSRWIYELLNNCFTTCDLFERAAKADLSTPFDWRHEHRLVVNGNQSFESTANDAKTLSALCLDCHFHFVFGMSWDAAHEHELCKSAQATWPMREDAFPWHHLVWVGSEPDHALEKSKYYPLLAKENFACCCSPCTFELTLEVSEPRLGPQAVGLLQDRDAILIELAKAKEKDPARYEAATEEWAWQAPINLNTYLKNLLEAEPDNARSIQKRNKRFAVIFGPRCFELFQQLEFEEEQFYNEQGDDEGSFSPKIPDESCKDPRGHTNLGTYRAYIEDVRAEIQCLIQKGPAGEPNRFINTFLHTDLGCTEVTGISSNALVQQERYRLLGVLPTQSPEIIVNAYFRQWDLLPNKRKELVDCIMSIANDCGIDRLEDFAIAQSSVFEDQRRGQTVQTVSDGDGLVNQALLYLDLSPPNTYASSAIIDAFRKKLAGQPAEASSAREMLTIIAQASNDVQYQTDLVMEKDPQMSQGTSEAVLGLSNPTSREIFNTVQSRLKYTSVKDERQTLIQAGESLARHTEDHVLAKQMADLRQEYVNTETLGLDDAAEDAGDVDLPVGLNNIGNTCYLNSLLQYLFTIKAVRDIVSNYDEYRLNLQDDSIQQRRLGGNKMEMDRAEAVAALAFVHELEQLFQRLRTSDRVATRPSQKLANAALLSTRSLVEEPKTENEPALSTEPPPLPARPPPSQVGPPTPPPEQMDTTADGVGTELQAVSSRGSSETLIDASGELPSAKDVTQQTSQDAVGSAVTDAKYEAGQTAPTPDAAEDVIKPAFTTDLIEDPQEIDIRVLKALEHQTRSSGTDQQDVGEVMGSIISLLQAAIRPSHVDKATGIQYEKIIETFFVTTINYTKDSDSKEYKEEVSYDGSITAFPAPDGPCSLYEALGRNFDQQVLDGSQSRTRYTSIKSLPPVLQVLVQRTQSNGRKNDNPVLIPETLYLDRYMDAPHDSPEFKRRMEDWATSARFADAKAQKKGIDELGGDGALVTKWANSEQPAPKDNDVMEVDQATNGETTSFKTPPVLEAFDNEDWSFDGPVDEDFVLISNPSKTASSDPVFQVDAAPPLGLEAAEKAVKEMVDAEIAKEDKTLSEHFDSSREYAYRLEAVICHRGVLHAGHYWVWIHDFEEGIWRCYNDAKVTVERDTEKVLRDLSNGGEPYYLCYVRDEDKEELVSVPKREILTTEDADMAEPELTPDEDDKKDEIDLIDAENPEDD